MRKFMQKYYFLGLILSIISLGVQLYNSVLSWYLTSLPKSGYKTHFFLLKNDTVLYYMIEYVFLQEFAKKSRKKIKLRLDFVIFCLG